MARGQTAKPCHGCQKVVISDFDNKPRQFRASDEVCDDCIELIELGQLFKQRAEETAEGMDFHQVAAMRGESTHPYWIFPGNIDRILPCEVQQALVSAIESLARACSTKIDDPHRIPRPPVVDPETGQPRLRKAYYGSDEMRVVKEQVTTVDALAEANLGIWSIRDFGNTVARYGFATLSATISTAVRAAYQKGRVDGSSILHRLATGEVSQTEFDAVRRGDDNK